MSCPLRGWKERLKGLGGVWLDLWEKLLYNCGMGGDGWLCVYFYSTEGGPRTQECEFRRLLSSFYLT